MHSPYTLDANRTLRFYNTQGFGPAETDFFGYLKKKHLRLPVSTAKASQAPKMMSCWLIHCRLVGAGRACGKGGPALARL